MNMYQHLTETFEAAERAHPDLMERYSARLAEATDAGERTAIMRAGLRETICQRYPLPEAHSIGAKPEPQGAFSI